jgi:peroxiredoxin
MMKKIIYLPVFIILMAGCSSEPHYVVRGNIEGSGNIVFFLKKREAGKFVTIDSAISKKGSFTIKGGTIEYPQLIQLIAGDTKKMTSFYLENSKITITGSLDSLFKVRITGSKTQDEYQSLIDLNKPISERYSQLYKEYQTALQTGDTMKVKVIQKQAEAIQKEMIDLQKNFVKDNPASYVSPSLLGSLIYEMESEEIESMINSLDTSLASVPQVISLKEKIAVMKTVAVGQKAPEFIMNDVDDKPVSLSSKIGSRLLLIDFWAAWCGPCRQENPNIVKVYNEFHKKGFDIFAVSLDQKKENWIKAINDDKLTWTHVSDLQYWSNAAAKMYAVSSIPANFLLDETGTIIGRNLRGEALYNKVNEVLSARK